MGCVLTVRGERVETTQPIPEVVNSEPGEWQWLIPVWPSKVVVPATLSSQVCSDSKADKHFSFRLKLERYQDGYHFDLVKVEGTVPRFIACASAMLEEDTLMTTRIVHKYATPISTDICVESASPKGGKNQVVLDPAYLPPAPMYTGPFCLTISFDPPIP